jgi:hypothetical protein
MPPGPPSTPRFVGQQLTSWRPAAVESLDTAYLPKPSPPAASGGCPVPNTTGAHASVFGKWYRAYGTGYGINPGGVSGYSAAETTCSNAGGKIATFKNQYQQWVVESILFPNSTAGTVDSYWVGNVYKATL